MLSPERLSRMKQIRIKSEYIYFKRQLALFFELFQR
jgi:hypothetical protein